MPWRRRSALLDAIARESAALDEARSGLDEALSRADADVDAARTAVARTDETDQEDELASARANLEAAAGRRDGNPRDLVLAYRLAREAESAAEEVVARSTRARSDAPELAAVDAEIRAAELSTDRAEEFIASREPRHRPTGPNGTLGGRRRARAGPRRPA